MKYGCLPTMPLPRRFIWVIYDGYKSGLNDALRTPWFALLTIDSMARWVVAGSWHADNDYGERLFSEFSTTIYPDLQKYCGVDLSQLFPDLELQLIKMNLIIISVSSNINHVSSFIIIRVVVGFKVGSR